MSEFYWFFPLSIIYIVLFYYIKHYLVAIYIYNNFTNTFIFSKYLVFFTAYTYICINTHIHIPINIYTYTHLHIYTHTHVH